MVAGAQLSVTRLSPTLDPPMKYLLAAALGLLLTACSPEGRQDPAEASREADREAAPSGTGKIGQICRYGKRPKGVVVTTLYRNGTAYVGDTTYDDLEKMTPRLGLQVTDSLPSIVAAPVVNVFSVRDHGNCYDARRKVYYSCVKYRRADLRDIRVMTRGFDADAAARRAVRLCQERVIRRAIEKTGIDVASVKLRCRVVAQRTCPPPKPAPKRTPPAKN